MSEAFDDSVTDHFAAHYDTVRGHVRQEVTRANLLACLAVNYVIPKIEALDYQGGDGRDAIWLADHGCGVILLDKSPVQIERAKANLRAADPGIHKAVEIKKPGDMEQLDNEDEFDVILSHCVLKYELEDPQGQLDRLSRLLRPGGTLSLLNPGHKAALSKTRGEEALEQFHQNGKYIDGMGLEARAYGSFMLRHMLKQAGLKIVAVHGVRFKSDADNRRIADVEPIELKQILAVERQASSRRDLADQAQLLHLIAMKPE